MKLIKLEVYKNSDREEAEKRFVFLSPKSISSAALHPHADKPELVLSDYPQTSFFLTQSSVEILLLVKSLIKLSIWPTTEKLSKLTMLINPDEIAFLSQTNGFEYLHLNDGSPFLLTDEAKKDLEKYV